MQGNSCAREYYGGAGGLTKALNKIDIPCQCFEAHPATGYDPRFDMELDVVVNKELSAARAHAYRFAHFGITCTTWSTLYKLNGGTRSRSLPVGTLEDPKELRGNLQHD